MAQVRFSQRYVYPFSHGLGYWNCGNKFILNFSTDDQETESEATGSPSHSSAPITIVSTSATNAATNQAAIDNPNLLQANSAGSSAPVTSSPGSPGAALHQGYNLNTPKSKAYPRAVQLLSRPKCIEITPLPHIPGGKIEKYLGNLNFFFIRETTSIREVSRGLANKIRILFSVQQILNIEIKYWN